MSNQRAHEVPLNAKKKHTFVWCFSSVKLLKPPKTSVCLQRHRRSLLVLFEVSVLDFLSALRGEVIFRVQGGLLQRQKACRTYNNRSVCSAERMISCLVAECMLGMLDKFKSRCYIPRELYDWLKWYNLYSKIVTSWAQYTTWYYLCQLLTCYWAITVCSNAIQSLTLNVAYIFTSSCVNSVSNGRGIENIFVWQSVKWFAVFYLT